MKKIDLGASPTRHGTGYPPPHDAPCRDRQRWMLGDAAGLTQFGVNLLRLPPGTWSAQRHWHSAEDEFVYVLQGSVVLVTEEGEECFGPGDCVGFRAGTADGHHFMNRSPRDAVLLEVGTRARAADAVTYPDIDLALAPGAEGYTHRDGMPYA